MAHEKINDYLQHTLREDFTSPNPEVRKGAIYALGRLGSGPDVLLILRNISSADEDPEVRYTAKKALNYWEGVLSENKTDEDRAPIAGPDGRLHLSNLDQALSSPHAGTQIAGIVDSVRLGDPGCLPLIERMLDHEQDPWVLSMAIKAIGSLGDSQAIPKIAPFLKSKNHRVTANTIEALEMLGDPDIAGRLEPFLLSEDNRVRANAVKALHPYQPDVALDTLEKMAINHRPWMRASAIYCLKVLDNPRCQPLLLEMAKKEYSDDLTRQLLDAVVAQGGEEAVGVLGVMAETEGDRQSLAKSALTLLSGNLGLSQDRVQELTRIEREKNDSEESLKSGMFRLDPLEALTEIEESEEPSRPKRPSSSRLPSGGYGVSTQEAAPPSEDPGSKKILWGALALALLASAYAVYRLAWDPPTTSPVVEESLEEES